VLKGERPEVNPQGRERLLREYGTRTYGYVAGRRGALERGLCRTPNLGVLRARIRATLREVTACRG